MSFVPQERVALFIDGANLYATAKALWTAEEFYGSMMPVWFAQQSDRATVLGPMTRAAHLIALRRGIPWNTEGRYAIDVWSELYRADDIDVYLEGLSADGPPEGPPKGPPDRPMRRDGFY